MTAPAFWGVEPFVSTTWQKICSRPSSRASISVRRTSRILRIFQTCQRAETASQMREIPFSSPGYRKEAASAILRCARTEGRFIVGTGSAVCLASARPTRHIASGRGQPSDELGVFGRGAAEVEHGTQPLTVAREKCLRIEPQSRKGGRTIQPIAADWSLHQHALFLAKPEDFVRVHRVYDILQDPGLLIVGQLRPEVDVPGRLGDLDDEFWSTVDEPALVPRPTAAFGQDAEQPVRLRLALPAQDRRGVVHDLHSGAFLGVIGEPHDHRNLGYAVRQADRTGHIDDSIDQFGPGTGRHRFVERVEGGLVEPLTLDQRAGRIEHLGALGHDLTISSIDRRLDLMKPTCPWSRLQVKAPTSQGSFAPGSDPLRIRLASSPNATSRT